MSFKENFIKLCNQKGEAPTFVCGKVGLSNATFTCWTDESVPRKATLMRIADYFGVTVDYLLGKEDAPMTDASLSDSEKTMLTWFRSLSEDEQEAILRVFVEKNGGQ